MQHITYRVVVLLHSCTYQSRHSIQHMLNKPTKPKELKEDVKVPRDNSHLHVYDGVERAGARIAIADPALIQFPARAAVAAAVEHAARTTDIFNVHRFCRPVAIPAGVYQAADAALGVPI